MSNGHQVELFEPELHRKMLYESAPSIVLVERDRHQAQQFERGFVGAKEALQLFSGTIKATMKVYGCQFARCEALEHLA